MTIGKIIAGGILGLAGIVAAAGNKSPQTEPQQTVIYVGHLDACDKEGDGYSFKAAKCTKVGEYEVRDVKTFRYVEDNAAYGAISDAFGDGKDVHIRALAYDISNKAIISITPDQIVEFSDHDPHNCGCQE